MKGLLSAALAGAALMAATVTTGINLPPQVLGWHYLAAAGALALVAVVRSVRATATATIAGATAAKEAAQPKPRKRAAKSGRSR